MDTIKGSLLSFYSKPFYYSLALPGRGIGVGHIFVRTFIAVVATIILFHATTPGFVDKVATVFAGLPVMTCKEDRISIDAPMPYNINFGDADDPYYLVIDTNYKVTSPADVLAYMQGHKILAILTDNQLVSLKSQDEVDIRDLRDALKQPFVITQNEWKDIAQKIRDRAMPIMTLSLVIIITLVNFIETFVTAIVVLSLGAIARMPLMLDQAMRVSAAFRIPTLVLGWTIEWMRLPAASWIAWIVWLGYLVFAVMATRLPSDQTAA